MHSVITAMGGALSLALVLYMGLVQYPAQIEQHLLVNAQASLKAAQIQWARVRMSGRDLHLHGTAPDIDTHRYALRLLDYTKGVRIIVDETSSAPGAKLASAIASEDAPASKTPNVRTRVPQNSARSTEQAARLCQTSFDGLLSGQRVKFVPDQALVSLESAVLLQQVAQAAMRCNDARLEIAAHTDSAGDPAESFSRSHAHAGAVVDYLVSQGVQRARLEARGYGAQAPIASNRSATGRERNRRIEITVLRETE